MCDCIELIKRNKKKIVAEAIKAEIIRTLAKKVSEQIIEVDEDGSITFVLESKIDERVVGIAYKVIDEIIKLLESS